MTGLSSISLPLRTQPTAVTGGIDAACCDGVPRVKEAESNDSSETRAKREDRLPTLLKQTAFQLSDSDAARSEATPA